MTAATLTDTYSKDSPCSCWVSTLDDKWTLIRYTRVMGPFLSLTPEVVSLSLLRSLPPIETD